MPGPLSKDEMITATEEIKVFAKAMSGILDNQYKWLEMLEQLQSQVHKLIHYDSELHQVPHLRP